MTQEEKRGTLSGQVLVIDDEALTLRAVSTVLQRAGYEVRVASSGSEALRILNDETQTSPDVIVTDLHLTDMTGTEIVDAAKTAAPGALTIVMTGQATLPSAVDAMRRGAYDYLSKPFADTAALVAVVERAMTYKRLFDRNRYLEERLGTSDAVADLIGSSAGMRRVASLIETVGPTDATVLVLGESGTGKELVVRALHRCSRRRDKALLAINCGALAESVLESELFGHVKGAFTGALTARKGLFEAAAGGVVFLDEIGETPASVQVRLLRVLQEREVKPMGANEARPVDVRIVAATHRDLTADVEAGRFRQDLFYRLNVVAIEVPPLRARREDIPLLAVHFLRKHAVRHGRKARDISPSALDLLSTRDWPGNVRELENAIERAVVFCPDETLTTGHLQPSVKSTAAPIRSERPPTDVTLANAKHTFEREYLQKLMTETAGNFAEMARISGLDRSNLRRQLRRFDIDASEPSK